MLLKKRRRPNFSVATYHFPDAHPSFGSCGLDDFSMLGWQWAVKKTCTLNSILLCKRGPYDDLLQCPYTVSGIIPCTTQTTKVLESAHVVSKPASEAMGEFFASFCAHSLLIFSSAHSLQQAASWHTESPQSRQKSVAFLIKKRNPSFHAQMKHPTTFLKKTATI